MGFFIPFAYGTYRWFIIVSICLACNVFPVSWLIFIGHCRFFTSPIWIPGREHKVGVLASLLSCLSGKTFRFFIVPHFATGTSKVPILGKSQKIYKLNGGKKNNYDSVSNFNDPVCHEGVFQILNY